MPRLSPSIVVAIGLGAIIILGAGSQAAAQDLLGSLSGSTPLFSFPSLRGEVYARPQMVRLLSGKQTIANNAWFLRNDFGFNRDAVFVDSMVRFQLWRLSLRINYDPRDFSGSNTSPSLETASSRFSFPGLRVGGDFDILQWEKSRLGINIDYDVSTPTFTEGIKTLGGKEIRGDAPVTLGFHFVFNPTRTLFGMSAIAEARARWPVAGVQVTDWEVSGGLRSPETVLGSWALQGGYRRTSLDFDSSQIYLGTSTSTHFDISYGGPFIGLYYYY